MDSPRVRPLRFLGGILAALLVVAGCASAAPASPTSTPTAEPTATAVPTAQPTPRPTPTVEPTASPKPEAAARLKIGAPYKLQANPANKALNGSISFDMGGQQAVETISGREITKDGTVVGMVIVLQIDGIPMTDQVFEGGAKGAANNISGKLAYTTVLGERVAMVTAKAGTVALYRLDDLIVMVIGTKAADTKPLLTSVIKANA